MPRGREQRPSAPPIARSAVAGGSGSIAKATERAQANGVRPVPLFEQLADAARAAERAGDVALFGRLHPAMNALAMAKNEARAALATDLPAEQRALLAAIAAL